VLSSSPSIILLEVTSEILRSFNVFGLGALVTTGKKNDQQRTPLLKKDPEPRVIVNLQFIDSCSNGATIAWISADDAFNLSLNECLSPEGPKAL
jgi:hypothetical protein